MTPEEREQLEALFGAPSQESDPSIEPSRMTSTDLLDKYSPALDPSKASSVDAELKLRENIKADKGSPEMDNEVLQLVKSIKSNISEDGSIPGAGLITNYLMDPEDSERGAVGKTTNMLMSLFSQDANEVQSDRSAILAKQYQKAYETLKGGGQITVYEGRTVAAALTKLGQTGLTDETILEELNRIERVLEHSTQRGQANIQTDGLGREYQILPEGGRRQVATGIDSKGQLKIIDLQGEDAVFVPNHLSKEQKVNFINQLPKGQSFVVQDKDGNLKKGKK